MVVLVANITFQSTTQYYRYCKFSSCDAGSSEFTVSGSPITTSGTITLAVNSINVSKITNAASKGFATAMAIALKEDKWHKTLNQRRSNNSLSNYTINS